MLTLQDKGDIYDLLIQGFDTETRIPMATLALYLRDKGFSYEKFGYKKLKSLLNDLEFLSFDTDNENNHCDVFVTIHPFQRAETFPHAKKAVSSKDELPTIRIKENLAPKAHKAPLKKENKTFDEAEKKKVKNLLLKEFSLGSTYPLSQVSKYLSDQKIDYKGYGYKKMKSLLEDLSDTLTLSEDPKKKGLYSVTFLGEKKENTKKTKKTNNHSSHTNLPEPTDTPFYVPDKLLLSIKEFSDLKLDDASILKLIYSDYKKAYESKNFKEREKAMVFPLSFKTKDGEDVIASLKKATGPGYSYYLNFVGSDKEKAKDVLKNHVYFADFDSSIADLAHLAKKEPWCYHHSSDPYIILKIYLQYTYSRLVYQKKVSYDEASHFAAFNTGLKNERCEDIYGILLKSEDPKISQEYIFQGFALAGTQGLGKILIEHFNPLPEKATYIHSLEDLYFNPSSEIHTDSIHIIYDNLDRFPLPFLKALLLPFLGSKSFFDSIEKEKDESKKEILYNKLRQKVEENSAAYSILKLSLDQSIAKAKRMVAYDYRNALPSFFPTRNVMSMMLPLDFNDSGKIEAVLLVEKTPSGNYQGQTMLTLKQCYVNARLLGPLENTFLDASQIED